MYRSISNISVVKARAGNFSWSQFPTHLSAKEVETEKQNSPDRHQHSDCNAALYVRSDRQRPDDLCCVSEEQTSRLLSFTDPASCSVGNKVRHKKKQSLRSCPAEIPSCSWIFPTDRSYPESKQNPQKYTSLIKNHVGGSKIFKCQKQHTKSSTNLSGKQKKLKIPSLKRLQTVSSRREWS